MSYRAAVWRQCVKASARPRILTSLTVPLLSPGTRPRLTSAIFPNDSRTYLFKLLGLRKSKKPSAVLKANARAAVKSREKTKHGAKLENVTGERGRTIAFVPVQQVSTTTATGPRKTGPRKVKKPRARSGPLLDDHHDLETYIQFAKARNLDPESNVYRGTHYEYLVALVLHDYAFALTRCGGANDGGVDLHGELCLPGDAGEMSVQVECKSGKTRPEHMRALAGVCGGGRDERPLGILASPRSATRGIQACMEEAPVPLAYAQIVSDGGSNGVLVSLELNSIAKAKLKGMSVDKTFKFVQNSNTDAERTTVSTIVLKWESGLRRGPKERKEGSVAGRCNG